MDTNSTIPSMVIPGPTMRSLWEKSRKSAAHFKYIAASHLTPKSYLRQLWRHLIASSCSTTSTMASRNGSPTATMESTGFIYPCNVPNVDEREPLLPQNSDECVKKLYRLQLLNDAREVALRNTGLLLIVAGEAFFAIADAIVQTLQKVDPPVTTLQVRLKSNCQWSDVWILPPKLMVIRMTIIYIGCMIYMCVRSHSSLRLVFASFG